MMKFIQKLVLKYLYVPEALDEVKLKDWLFKSFRDQGFKQYYTMRKRILVNLLILENDPMKRSELQGRLNELGGLSANITQEAKRRKK